VGFLSMQLGPPGLSRYWLAVLDRDSFYFRSPQTTRKGFAAAEDKHRIEPVLKAVADGLSLPLPKWLNDLQESRSRWIAKASICCFISSITGIGPPARMNCCSLSGRISLRNRRLVSPGQRRRLRTPRSSAYVVKECGQESSGQNTEGYDSGKFFVEHDVPPRDV